MIYSNFTGRIAKKAKLIDGVNGQFLSMDLAVNDYSKGEETTQWVCSVPSAPSRHSAYASGRQSFQSLCGYFPMTAQLGSELFHLFVVNDPLDVFLLSYSFLLLCGYGYSCNHVTFSLR